MKDQLRNGRDLFTQEELRALSRKVQDMQNRAFTWHNLSLFTAKILLFVFFVVWLGIFWWMIEPTFGISLVGGLRFEAEEVFYGLISAAIAVGLAFACTTVPPIFWSSLIAQTPASELMNKLYAKYGRSGFYIACIGAIVFTMLGFDAFRAFWLAKPNVVMSSTYAPTFWSIISVFLAIIFPAWALNKSTPEQWIAGIVQAREVARLQHALNLEEMIGAAMVARASAILHADLTTMTMHERENMSRELAAILATSERRVNKAFVRIGQTFQVLYNMSLQIQTDDDDRLLLGYQKLAGLLNDTASVTGEDADRMEGYMHVLPSTPMESVSIIEQRETRAVGRHSVPDGQEALQASESIPDALRSAQSGSDGATDEPTYRRDAWLMCRKALTLPWKATDIERVGSVSNSTATRIIKNWIESGHIQRTDREGFYFWTDIPKSDPTWNN